VAQVSAENDPVATEASSTRTAMRSKPKLQGVARAMRVLELIAERPMTASEAAEALDLPWATCYRTLVQLEKDQYLERAAGGEYRVGRHTWLIGSTYLVGHPLLDLAMPLLQSASSELPAAVFQLVERSGDIALVLYSHEPVAGEPITRATFGHHIPLHAGSKGWVLLAYESEEVVNSYLESPLLALTATTITDPADLRAELRRTREQGYAITMADVQTFTGSVAAPVFDASGSVVAAVCAIMLRSRLSNLVTRQTAIDTVLGVAQSLSLGAGWQPVRVAQQAHTPRTPRRGPGRPRNGASKAR
jgi:DNA-binding IclR family transcriptional regulator